MNGYSEDDILGKIELDKSICTRNYKDFKKTDKGQQMIEKYLDRWDKLSFIDGLKGELKERCAFAMEQLAVYLITEAVEKELTEPFEIIGFPMIRRICCGSVGNHEQLNDLDLFNFEKFIKYSKELNVVGLMEDVDKIIGDTQQYDAEAEACALGCEVIIKKFNGDERSLDSIKTEFIDKIKEKIKKRHEGTGSDNTDA